MLLRLLPPQGVEWPQANRSKLSLAFIAVDVAEAAIANEQAPPTSALRTLGSGRLASSGGSLPRSGSKLGPAADKAVAAAAKEGSLAAAGGAAAGDGVEAARPKILDRLKFSDDDGEGAGSPAAAEAAEAAAAAAAPPAAEEETVTLDDLFRKTKAKPHLYYLPLNDEEVAAKKARREVASAAGPSGAGGSGHSASKEPVGPAVMEGLGA